MDKVLVPARPRLLAGSDVARKVRRAGLLPANLHGNGQPARSIAADPKVVRRGLQSAYGRDQIFEITVAGDAKPVLAIAREEAACLAEASGLGLYDALLDQYEPGMRAAEVERLAGEPAIGHGGEVGAARRAVSDVVADEVCVGENFMFQKRI